MTDSEAPPETDRPGTVATGERLHFVTSNDAKYRTAADVFGPEIALERTRVDVPEIQSTSPETVVERKANDAYAAVGAPVLVDDFAFFVDGLDEFPGPLVKHLLKETGLRGLRGLYSVSDSGSSASASASNSDASADCTLRCTVATCDGEACILATGQLRGTLRLASDYADPSSDMLLSTVFVPDGHDRPLSELRIADHRREAYSNLKARLLG